MKYTKQLNTIKETEELQVGTNELQDTAYRNYFIEQYIDNIIL